jgi:hypothetical protein
MINNYRDFSRPALDVGTLGFANGMFCKLNDSRSVFFYFVYDYCNQRLNAN